MEKEFNLNKKRSWIEAGSFKGWIYHEEDVKKFIRLLKEDDVEILAEFLHNTYEELSKLNDWKTQKKCRVKFKDLPEENKKVMLQLSAHIITRNNVRIFELAGDKLI